jgi:hypothetical protein
MKLPNDLFILFNAVGVLLRFGSKLWPRTPCACGGLHQFSRFCRRQSKRPRWAHCEAVHVKEFINTMFNVSLSHPCLSCSTGASELTVYLWTLLDILKQASFRYSIFSKDFSRARALYHISKTIQAKPNSIYITLCEVSLFYCKV